MNDQKLNLGSSIVRSYARTFANFAHPELPKSHPRAICRTFIDPDTVRDYAHVESTAQIEFLKRCNDCDL